MPESEYPTCRWFALCDQPAPFGVEHPTIGWVDICEHHLSWLMDNPGPTSFVPPLAAKHYHKVQAVLEGAE